MSLNLTVGRDTVRPVSIVHGCKGVIKATSKCSDEREALSLLVLLLLLLLLLLMLLKRVLKGEREGGGVK